MHSTVDGHFPQCEANMSIAASSTLVYMCIQFHVLILGVEILGHEMCMSSTLLGKTKLFSKVIMPINTPIRSILELPLLHISVNT